MANDNTLNVEITASVQGLKQGLNQAEKGVKGFGTATDKMTGQTNKMTGGLVKGAVPAMTSFSQVVQDAPYGIRGVANNITQLTMQLGHLSKNAGGTGAAIKAMGATLMGPAGILLVVSLITSLMVTYGDELANVGSESATLAKKNGELVESLGVTKTLLKAQIGTLDAQLSILEAQGVSTEELLSQKLKLLETELLTLTNQKHTLGLQIANTEQVGLQLTLAQKLANAFSIARGGGIIEFAGLDRDEIDKINELKTALANADTAIFKTIEAIGKIKAPEIFDPKKTKVKEKIATFKGDVVTGLQGVKEGLLPIANEIGVIMTNLIPESAKVQFTDLQMSFAGLVENLKATAENGLGDVIANMAFSIGEAIAGGTNALRAAGGAMLGVLGKILTQFGELTLAYGIANLALFTAITSGPNPISAGVAIAAGAALIAIGGAISAFSKNALGDKSGGASTSTDYSKGSGSRGSSVNSSNSGGGGGTYVFEIAGTKLIGVLKNTLDRNRALGGTNLSF